MIVLAFDFGKKNIGVAVGQNITKTAKTLSCIKIKKNVINFEIFKKLFYEWKPYVAIVGLPLNMDGTQQKITKHTKKFAKQLFEHFKIPIYLHDERLTTIEAKTTLFEKYGFKSLKKERINSMSAVIILESWFMNNNSIYMKSLKRN
ncbi:MAG: Holliday junction resolvase RuvX [Buchnera aphidicola (Schlechtendalia peitan)]